MLTVLIPAYNHEHYVLESLMAARLLKLPGVKFIVIDDGSNDGTLNAVQTYQRTYAADDITVMTKPNSGLVSSLNQGLALCDTPYLYIVASDDVPVAEGILKCVEILEADRSLSFCIGGGFSFTAGKPELTMPLYGEGHKRFFSLSEEKRATALYLGYPQPILLQSAVFRVDALRAIGGWDPEIALDDYPTFVKLLSRFPEVGTHFVFRPDIHVVNYRQHDNNSFRNSERLYAMLKQMLIKLAPPSLLSRSLGRVLVLHFLAAVKSGEWLKAFKLFWRERVSVQLDFARYLVVFVAKYVKVKWLK